MNEEWIDIIGFNGQYQVSNLGRIKSTRDERNIRDKIRKINYDSTKYSRLTIRVKGKSKTFLVHRIVALHFIPNPLNLPEINHKNGIKSDNRIENLEWCTHKQNIDHSVGTGLWKLSKEHGIAFREGYLKKKCIPVMQYDAQNNFIAEYRSAAHAGRALMCDPGDISKCCKKKAKRVKGFIFKYKEK